MMHISDLELDYKILGQEIYSKTNKRNCLDSHGYVKMEAEKIIKKFGQLPKFEAECEEQTEKNNTYRANVHYNYSVFLHQLLKFFHVCYTKAYANENFKQARVYLQDAKETSDLIIEQTDLAYALYSEPEKEKTSPYRVRNNENHNLIEGQIKDIDLLLNQEIATSAVLPVLPPLLKPKKDLQEEVRMASPSHSDISIEHLPPKKRFKAMVDTLSNTNNFPRANFSPSFFAPVKKKEEPSESELAFIFV